MSKIPEELQTARTAAKLTHEALAQRAGVSRMTVQRTEAGKIDPRLSTLDVLSRALGLDLTLVPSTQAAQLPVLLSGDRLRQLFDSSAVPLTDMRTEEEVASWWKHFAGRVRNALKDDTAFSTSSAPADANASSPHTAGAAPEAS